MADYNGYKIEHLGTFAAYEIKNKGQGPVPKFLRGWFLSEQQAQQRVDAYLRVNQKKGNTNAKSESASTG